LISSRLHIPFEQFRLENGLQVIFHPDNKLPVAHVNLWYHVGSKNEKPGQTGFAHLFEHLMFEGSKHADTEYLTLLEKIGANLREGGVNGTTSFDRTNYFATVPSEMLEYLLWLESDRMGFLTDALTQEKLDNQRDVVKNERRQSYENVPYGRGLEIILKNLFPAGHPYSWMVIGSQEDLDGAEQEDFKRFFKTFYTPNNCSLVVSGNIDFQEARSWVEKYFGPIEPGPALERQGVWIPALSGEKRVRVEDRVPQERSYLIWPVPPYFHAGDAELDLASRLLSQGKNSRLYKTLVYDRQIASDVSAFNYSLEISGMFGIVTTARPGQDVREIERIIHEEIARFAAEGPTEEELAREKAKHEFDFVSGLERLGGFGGKSDMLNQYNTYLGSPDHFQEDYERYLRLTGENIGAAVHQYLNHAQHLAVTFMPEKGARSSLPSPDRSQVPLPGRKHSFHPPHLACSKLSNGLKVISVERRDIPKVSVALVLNTGSCADPAESPGTAWMTAGMLDEGTQTRSALQLQAEIDRLGSVLQTYAETEVSRVSVECLRAHLDASLDLLADVVLHPSFPDEELERMRKRRLDSILQEKHNPPSIARKLFRRTLFGPAHPLGKETGGNEASIQGLKTGDLKGFYSAQWKPGLGTLIFSGDITHQEAWDYASRFWGDWKNAHVEPVILPVPPDNGAIRIRLIDRPEAPQSQIRAGGVGPARTVADFHAIELLNSILGGAFSSRLNLNLREDKGFTYGAFSSFAYGRHLGLWVCGAAVHTQFTRESLYEFFSEIREIRGPRPVTPAELEVAKTNLIQGYAQRFETLDRLIDQVTELTAYDLPLESLREVPAQVEAVTLDQVQAAAEKYLQPESLSCVVVGDLRKIEEEIRGASLGDVTVVDVDGNPVS
jgi:zinc protease